MSQGVHLRKYGVEAVVNFELYDLDGVDMNQGAASASGDINIMRDEAAEEQLDADAFVDEGKGYSVTLSATEMQAKRVAVYIIDQTSPKDWLDKCIIVETYGNASAQHAMDFDDADGSTLTEVGGDGAQLTEAGGDGDHLLEAGGDGDHLTAINLPNQTMDIIGSITGNLSGSVGSVTGAVGSVTGAVGSVTGAVGSVTGNVGGDVAGNVDGTVAGKTPSEAGDAMTLAAAAIDNATFDADVGSTAYATNIIALAVRKVLDELNLDHLMKVATSNRATLPEVVDDTVLANIMTATDGDTSDFDITKHSLEAIGADADTILADTNELQTDDVPTLIAAVQTEVDKIDGVDTVVDAIKVVTDLMADSASTLVTGTVEAGGGPTTTVFQTNLAETTDDHYNGRIVIFLDNDLKWQASDITDYTGATGTITVTAMTEAPSAGDTFVVV